MEYVTEGSENTSKGVVFITGFEESGIEKINHLYKDRKFSFSFFLYFSFACPKHFPVYEASDKWRFAPILDAG